MAIPNEPLFLHQDQSARTPPCSSSALTPNWQRGYVVSSIGLGPHCHNLEVTLVSHAADIQAIDNEYRARDRLHQCQQTGSVIDYPAAFRAGLLECSDVSDAEALD